MSRCRPYGLRHQEVLHTHLRPSEEVNAYFLLFATDADRELRISIREAASYRTLREGRPAPLRKCKVMVQMFDRIHWFLVATRQSDESERNQSIHETMAFCWNGPLTVMRLERRGARVPVGILTSEHHQAAIAAVERFLCIMSAELSQRGNGIWRTFITDDRHFVCNVANRV